MSTLGENATTTTPITTQPSSGPTEAQWRAIFWRVLSEIEGSVPPTISDPAQILAFIKGQMQALETVYGLVEELNLPASIAEPH